ncbi:MAG: hypothetical protein CMJ89_11940 [Planctomycetes bacterium]|jgi:4-amino-4-deoxy-L-arabinose transferase-like glycosyltransferase|nr:hypothetical protein [Planctomycetota bacterium]
MKPRWALAALVTILVAVHVAITVALPHPRFWGDEGHYLELATTEAGEPGWSLLPGTLGFDHRPLLNVRILSLFAPAVYPAIAYINILFLVVLVLCTHATAKHLGLSKGAGMGATAFLAFFPWLGFHVHTLWPELLHAALFAAIVLLFLRFLESGRILFLVPAGVAMGYALFAKGSLQPFLILFFAFIVWKSLRSPLQPAQRLARSAMALLAFAIPLLLVVLPQLLANQQQGHGLRLAANRWWNLEVGITSSKEVKIGEIDRGYWIVSPDRAERERQAEERTLDYVTDTGVLRVGWQQLGKLWKLLAKKPSGFERSLNDFDRWGETAPVGLRSLELPARIAWYLLWVLGIAGVACLARKNPGWTFLALMSLGYFIALVAVPVKIRFALPLVQLLALFAAGAGEELWRRCRPARN